MERGVDGTAPLTPELDWRIAGGRVWEVNGDLRLRGLGSIGCGFSEMRTRVQSEVWCGGGWWVHASWINLRWFKHYV